LKKLAYGYKVSEKRFKTCIRPGVDVMITIFGDLWQFSAKKLAFFSKTNDMIKILHNSASFWVKNAYFSAEFFWRKYFKNHNIGPCLNCRCKMGL
jgi:hypothetical protein